MDVSNSELTVHVEDMDTQKQHCAQHVNASLFDL